MRPIAHDSIYGLYRSFEAKKLCVATILLVEPKDTPNNIYKNDDFER